MGFDRTRKDLGIDAIRFGDALNELYGDPQVNILSMNIMNLITPQSIYKIILYALRRI